MSFTILSKGFLTTIQDLGRFGYQAQGVPVSGVMDMDAAIIANTLVGNSGNEALLEMAFMGASLKFHAPRVIAISGGDFSPMINGISIANYRAIYVKPDDILSFGTPKDGTYCYIALAGGIDVPLVMGSRSTYIRGSMGGLNGAKLEAGATINLCKNISKLPNMHLRYVNIEKNPSIITDLRVVLGPQDDDFTDIGLSTFINSIYTATSELDRMGCRFDGEIIEHKGDGNIISDGLAFGSIQVPSHGKPIVMLADRQTVGGYSKIASVISCDRSKLVQLRPGDKVRFIPISIQEAQELYIKNYNYFKALGQGLSIDDELSRHFIVEVNDEKFQVTLTQE